MSMPIADDDITLREIGRSLSDFRHEVRSQLQQVVRLDVYRAEQAADRARIAALEKDIERLETDRAREREKERDDAGQSRRVVLGALGTGIVGVFLALLSAVIAIAT